MKKLFLVSMSLFTLAFFIISSQTSCKKETVTVPHTDTVSICTPSIQGLWIGTFNSPAVPSQGDQFYSFIVYPDGTLLTKGKGGDGNFYYSTGTWTLSNDSMFEGTIVSFVTPGPNPVTQSISATFSNEGNGTLTNGTWFDVDNPNGAPLSGAFSTMQKVN